MGVRKDDRVHWPNTFYEKVCMCQGHFGGHDCSECVYGFMGPNCDQKRKPRLRKNALKLSTSERKQFVDTIVKAKKLMDPEYVIITATMEEVMAKLKAVENNNAAAQKVVEKYFKTESYWDVISWLHYYTARTTNNVTVTTAQRLNIPRPGVALGATIPFEESPVNFAHKGASFAPWHRYYLLLVEERLQKVANNPDFTLPYWDWTKETEKGECSVCTDDLVGAMDESDSAFILPSYLWTWDDGKEEITKYRGRRLSKQSPFHDWKVVCGFTEFTPNATRPNGYDETGLLCQGTTNEDEFLTRGYHFGKVTFEDGTTPKDMLLPSKEQVDALLNLETYDRIDQNTLRNGKLSYESFNHYTTHSFRNSLEGFMDSVDPAKKGGYMHNLVHDWIGGSVSNVPIAGNDPLFFLHHANVDRIFETWLRKYHHTAEYRCIRFGVRSDADEHDEPSGCPIGHDYREFMCPFMPLHTPARFFAGSDALGYVYDELAQDGVDAGLTGSCPKCPKCRTSEAHESSASTSNRVLDKRSLW